MSKVILNLLIVSLLGGLGLSDASACPISLKYCEPGTAELGFKLDTVTPDQKTTLEQKYLPKCENAVISKVGATGSLISKQVCQCISQTVLTTPGEWRAIHKYGFLTTSANKSPPLASQIKTQEKACLYAVVTGSENQKAKPKMVSVSANDSVPGVLTSIMTGKNQPKPTVGSTLASGFFTALLGLIP